MIWPNPEIFDDEFREQVATWQERHEDEAGRERYLRYKDGKVKQIMSLPDAELLLAEWAALV